MTDPIADMLTRIRNSYLAKKVSTVYPYSKLKLNLSQKLEELGYISNVVVEGEGKHKTISVKLIYKNKLPIITSIKRISTPGRRIYKSHIHLDKILSGYGASVLTTSKGILTDKEAKKAGVGGEVILQVW